MKITTLIKLLLFFITFLPPTLTQGEKYNVIDFGADPNSENDSSEAFSEAWKAACEVGANTTEAPTIYVPKGTYFIGRALKFSGRNCETIFNNMGITLRIEGTLIAPTEYMALGNVTHWISFESVVGVTITGGLLDGQGTNLWACKSNAYGNCPVGTTSLGFTNSENIVINGLRSVNSQLFHIVINGCENVKLQRLKIMAAGKSPNTDGIHVQQSNNIEITHSTIGTGDDCISIGAGTTNLAIHKILCGPGHGISIGSLGKSWDEAGVENVTVTAVVLKGTQNGVRIKSWGRPSNSYVNNVLFKAIKMDVVQNPIIIDQNYCPNNIGCPGQDSGVKISNVAYEDIQGSSATKVAVKFDCSPMYRCTNITMENVRLTYNQDLATSTCNNAGGTALGVIQPTSCIVQTG
ncbi:unnamed protein product [Amaranthus hypochondriacus]